METCQIQNYDAIDLGREIYPCHKCGKCHKHDESDRIMLAIIYLNINKLREIFSKMGKHDLLNYRHKNYDILHLFLVQLSSFSKSKEISMPPLLYSHFCEDSIFYLMDTEAKKLALEILELICSTAPKLITEKEINSMSENRATDIVRILSNHYLEEGNETCFICFSSHNSNLIDNTCCCKNKIHLECLITTSKKLGNICKTCKADNGAVFDSNGRLIFPFKNIYRMALMNRYVIVDDLNSQLHFAIAYLQYDRVYDLLSSITKDQYRNYYEHADYYALHRRNQNGALILLDVPYTNLSRDKNKDSFEKIEKLLAEYHSI